MSKKRKDAYYCYDVSQYQRIFPYLFKRRCDSLVYYEIEYDVTNLMKFVKQYNRSLREQNAQTGEKKPSLRFTTAVLIAFARVLAIRPKVNRFIKNKEFWQRKENSMVFVVKKSLNEDAPETSEQLTFNPFGTFEEYVELIENYITKCESQDIAQLNKSDLLIGKLFKFLPKFLISFIAWLVERCDIKKGMGRWLGEADCLHSSIFVANLSSLGISNTAPHHHLYEWGTTSMFAILGPVKRSKVSQEGAQGAVKDSIKISFTVDERICDGFYFVKTLDIIGDYLSNPEKMLQVPNESDIPHLMTKKEYKQTIKQKKRELKLLKKKRG